jgi:uncharacterized protein (TIGR02145 family)
MKDGAMHTRYIKPSLHYFKIVTMKACFVLLSIAVIGISHADVQAQPVAESKQPVEVDTNSLAYRLEQFEKNWDKDKEKEKSEAAKQSSGKETDQHSFSWQSEPSGDDAVIRSVAIKQATWMVENLNTERFRNGDRIPEAKTNAEWSAANSNKTPAWCYYNNEPANGTKYGKLYNWYAVIDPRGLAPKGWHVPTEKEWDALKGYKDGTLLEGLPLQSETGWGPISIGTNESGFSALPGGYRYSYGVFAKADKGAWWTSTSAGERGGAYGYIVESVGMVSKETIHEDGLSVRCLKD